MIRNQNQPQAQEQGIPSTEVEQQDSTSNSRHQKDDRNLTFQHKKSEIKQNDIQLDIEHKSQQKQNQNSEQDNSNKNEQTNIDSKFKNEQGDLKEETKDEKRISSSLHDFENLNNDDFEEELPVAQESAADLQNIRSLDPPAMNLMIQANNNENDRRNVNSSSIRASNRNRNEQSNQQQMAENDQNDQQNENNEGFEFIQNNFTGIDQSAFELYLVMEVKRKYLQKVAFLFLRIPYYGLFALVADGLMNFSVILFVSAAWQLYYIIKTSKHIKRRHITQRSSRWKFLNLMDWIYLFIYTVCLGAKIQGADIHVEYAIIPGVLGLVFHILFNSRPQIGRKSHLIFKIICWVQIVLITVKVAGSSDLSWGVAFLLIWVYLGFLLLLTLINFIFVLCLLISLLRGRGLFATIDKTTQTVGMLWHLGIMSSSVIILLQTIGAVSELSKDGSGDDLFFKSSISGIFHTLVMLTMTLLLKTQIQKFTLISMRQSFNQRNQFGSNLRPPYQVQFENLQPEKASFFDIISPTYFIPFDPALNQVKPLSQETFNRLKIKIYNLRQRAARFIDKLFAQYAERQSLSKEQIIQKIKEKQALVELKHSTSVIDIKNQEKENNITISDQHLGNKLCLSETDIKINEDIQKFKQINQNNNNDIEVNEENLCFICYQKEANTIFLQCGHGGMCYECAETFWKKQDTCTTCRKKIDKMVKLETINGLNLAKAKLITKKKLNFQMRNIRQSQNQ